MLKLGLVAMLVATVGGCEVGVTGSPAGDGPVAPGDASGPPPTTAMLHSILTGTFQPMLGVTGVGGRAQLVRTLAGATRIDVALAGLPANQTLTAHVHVGPCAYQGAGHYKIEPLVAETVEENELWLRVATSPDGVGRASVELAHMARGEALSIVVHATDGTKLACADLADGVVEVDYRGDLAPLASAPDLDQTIGGSIVASRLGDRTQLQLAMTSLDPASQYGAHVHAQPCDVGEGGGHYKLDPTVVDVIETNELWFAVPDHPAGSATVPLTTPHALRADAQSVVVHRVIGDQRPKVACADITRVTPYPAIERTGRAVPMPDALARGRDVSGAALVERTPADVTVISMVMGGLEPGIPPHGPRP